MDGKVSTTESKSSSPYEPNDELDVMHHRHKLQSGNTTLSEKDTALHDKFVRFSDHAEILSSARPASHRPRSKSVSAAGRLPQIKGKHTTTDDNDNVLQTTENAQHILLDRRAKTAAPKITRSPAPHEIEIDDPRAETVGIEELRIASASPIRRARSHSFSYLTLGQSKVSCSGKVRAVKDRTISLHGRTSRELRTLTNIDIIAAAEAEKQKREMEEKKRGMAEREKRDLQARVDNFLARLREEKHTKSSPPGLAVTI